MRMRRIREKTGRKHGQVKRNKMIKRKRNHKIRTKGRKRQNKRLEKKKKEKGE